MSNVIYGLQLTAFGMTAVFLALIVLSGLLVLMNRVVNPKKKLTAKDEISATAEKELNMATPSSPSIEATDDTELVAIITGAIAMMMQQQKGYVPNFKIASIKPTSDAWKMRGRGNLVSK